MYTDHPVPRRAIRHDGWTPVRKRQFLAALAAGLDVSKACAAVGLSRQAAYKARRRDPEFAHHWHAALRRADEARRTAFLAALPEKLLRTMSELSGMCELRGAGNSGQDTVRIVNAA